MFENLNAGRISPGEAKRILNRNGNANSDEEVNKIVDYLHALADLEEEHAENQNKKNASHSEQK